MNWVRIFGAASLLCAISHAAWAQSQFVGSWRGAWKDSATRQNGVIAFDIDGTGAISGSFGNAQLPNPAPASGRIGPDGRLLVTYSYDGGRATYTASGTLAWTDRQHIAGRMVFKRSTDGVQVGAGQVVLARNRSP